MATAIDWKRRALAAEAELSKVAVRTEWGLRLTRNDGKSQVMPVDDEGAARRDLRLHQQLFDEDISWRNLWEKSELVSRPLGAWQTVDHPPARRRPDHPPSEPAP